MAQNVNVGVQSEVRLMKGTGQEETHAGRGLLAAPRWVCKELHWWKGEWHSKSEKLCERNLGGGKEQGLFIAKLAGLEERECTLIPKPIGCFARIRGMHSYW